MNQLLTVLLLGGQQAASNGQQGGSSWMTIIFLGLIIVVFYFFMIRPGQKKAKEERQFRDSLSKGDKVITNTGMFGKIVEINEGNVVLEIAEGVKIKILKSAIMSHYDGSIEEKEKKNDNKANATTNEEANSNDTKEEGKKAEAKKKNIVNIVLIIVLVLGVVGFFVYTKWFKKEEAKPVEKINIENKVITRNNQSFTYTGEATKDSIPFGKGKAVFSNDSLEDRLEFRGEWKLGDTAIGTLYFKDTAKYKAIADTFLLNKDTFSYNKIIDTTEVK